MSLILNVPTFNEKLYGDYGSIFLKEIKENFTEEEQNLYIMNVVSYLNYDPITDYPINLDNIHSWLGYDKKGNAKKMLINNFNENEDYIIPSSLLIQEEKAASECSEAALNINSSSVIASEHSEAITEAKISKGGQNKEIILLNINCFKEFCLLARTEKSKQIHKYYIKLENILNKIIVKQTQELRIRYENSALQISQLISDKEDITTQLEQSEEEKMHIRESAFIEVYKNKNVVYFGYVDYIFNKKLLKFGHFSKSDRVFDHRSTFPNFKLIYVIETVHNRELEKLIKKHFKNNIRSEIYNNTNQTELIHLDNNLTIKKIKDQINLLKESIHSGEIIEKLIDENQSLKDEIEHIKNTSSSELVTKILLEKEILNTELTELKDTLLFRSIEEQEHGNCLCIVQNKNVPDLYKIIITEYSNDLLDKNMYTYVHTSNNVKLIKNMLIYLLKPCLNLDKITYTIQYPQLEKILLFSIAMYDEYCISQGIDRTVDFVNRYNTYKLKTVARERHSIDTDIYKKFINECIQYSTQYKIPTVHLCKEFYDWYIKNYDPDCTKSTIKIKGDWSSLFRVEFIENLEKYTKIKEGIVSIISTSKILSYSSYNGFTGISTNQFEQILKEKKTYYEDKYYKLYVDENITVTNKTNHRVSRHELLEDFTEYSKKNNFYNDKSFNKSFSTNFINEFIKNIEKYTTLKFEGNRTKDGNKGCFIGMSHKTIDHLRWRPLKKGLVVDTNLYKKNKRERLKEQERIKKQEQAKIEDEELVEEDEDRELVEEDEDRELVEEDEDEE